MRLRPYKSCDAKKIISWIKDEEVFLKWGGDHFGLYPISAEIIDNKYLNDNGDCKEEDNFYPWIAFTDEDGINCLIFKYKKNVLGKWLLGIVSESGTFSEMGEYNQKTEIDDAKRILEMLKNYWREMAKNQ